MKAKEIAALIVSLFITMTVGFALGNASANEDTTCRARDRAEWYHKGVAAGFQKCLESSKLERESNSIIKQ